MCAGAEGGAKVHTCVVKIRPKAKLTTTIDNACDTYVYNKDKA